MTFTPAHITQRDGSECWSRSCWCAVAAWLLAGATRGRADLSPQDVRRELRAWGCRTGGLGDIMQLLNRHHRTSRLHSDLDRDEARHVLDREGSLFALPTDYATLTGEPSDAYHMVGIVGGIVHSAVRVMDPMESHVRSLPLELVMRAGLQYGREHADGRTLDLLEVRIPAR